MPGSTIYDVQIRMMMEDQRAVAGTEKLGHALQRTHQHALGLNTALAHLGAAVGGALGVHQAYDAFVKFNQEVEQTKISLAAIVQLDLGYSFDQSKAAAEDLFQEFQRFSKLTPVTTKQMNEFGQGVAAAVFGAGGQMKDFVKITEQGVIAAKVFGAESNYAALELTELLQGTVNKRMRFAMQLLHGAHVSEEEFRRMNAGQRLRTIEGVLTSDAMKKATDQFSESFSGVTSTLVDNLQIMLGGVGMPLFKAITAEVQRWNHWIERNQAGLEKFGKQFSEALVEGFKAVKDAVGWVIDHREMLLTIAKAWLALKGINFATGAITGIASSMSSFSQSLSMGTMTVGRFAGAVNSAATAAVLLHAAAQALADYYDAEQTKRIKAQTEIEPALKFVTDKKNFKSEAERDRYVAQSAAAFIAKGDAAGSAVDQRRILTSLFGGAVAYSSAQRAMKGEGVMTMLEGRMTLDQARMIRAGLFRFGPNVSGRERDALQTVAAIMIAQENERRTLVRKQLEAFDKFHRALSIFSGLDKIMGAVTGVAKDPLGFGQSLLDKALGSVSQRPNVNVTIQHVEVQSPDPDRFVFDLVETAMDGVKHPGQARRTIREG